MAPQRVLKSLNKGAGKKRFVFKSFAQRVDEVDVDVFRSLTPIKFEPTSGCSFFQENLLQWRELNVTADFNAVFVELLPIVQTLPQLLFHKDKVVSSLLMRVRLDALLSLEPILSLIAVLSRDLREEFLPYMPQVLEACSSLLTSGGDQEPDLLEQVFVSISYIFKYLTKFLAKDIPFVLRITKSLRWYHRPFVQDFVAESVSYLLRKASPRQIIFGVRRLLSEVAADFSDTRVSSCCNLLFHSLKGPSSGLHSNAETLLHLLFDKSTLSDYQKAENGGGEDVAVQIVSKTLLLLCEHVKREKLDVLWACLIDHVTSELDELSPIVSKCAEESPSEESGVPLTHGERPACDDEMPEDNVKEKAVQNVQDESLDVFSGPGPPPETQGDTAELSKEVQAGRRHLHFVHLLSLLTDVLEFRKGSRVNDYVPLFCLVPRLLAPEFLDVQDAGDCSSSFGPLARSRVCWDWGSTVWMSVLRFVLALIKSHGQIAGASRGPGAIVTVSSTWGRAFDCKWDHCLLQFIKGLVEQDVSLVQIFAPQILRSLNRLADDNLIDILPIFFDFNEKIGVSPLCKIVANTGRLTSIITYIIEKSATVLKPAGLQQESCNREDYIDSLAGDPAVVWMALKCLPYSDAEMDLKASISWNYANQVGQMMLADVDPDGSESWVFSLREVWECLLATALASFNIISQRGDQQLILRHAAEYLELPDKYHRSSHILEAVSEGLDVLLGTAAPRQVVDSDSFRSNMTSLGQNLSSRSKILRTATLRILSLFEGLGGAGQDEQANLKRRKANDGEVTDGQVQWARCEAFLQLYAVESAVLTHENFRQNNLRITAVKVAACTRRVPESYVVPVFHAFIGLLRNRFALLWDGLVDGLAGMLDVYGMTVGEVLLSHLEMVQNTFLYHRNEEDEQYQTEDPEFVTRDLWTRFNFYFDDKYEGTQPGTLLVLLLRVLQKSANFSEARSRQLIPLFLRFVGHSSIPAEDDEEGVTRIGRDWKAGVKEWLNLIRGMRNARSLFKGPIVKEMLLNRFLSDRDPSIQQVTLDSLLNWKDKFLTLHEEHLKNLLSSKTLREELTTWNVAKESHLIQDEDRNPLLHVVLLILFPRIMKRTVKSMKKSCTGVQRNAILSFLARLESNELSPLFIQLMKPLEIAFYPSLEDGNLRQVAGCGWESKVAEGVDSHFIEQVYGSSVAAIPFKRKLGFLHVVMDSLEIFSGSQLAPYLHALLAVVFRLLETCSKSTEEEAFEDLRSSPSQEIFKANVEGRSLSTEGDVSADTSLNIPMVSERTKEVPRHESTSVTSKDIPASGASAQLDPYPKDGEGFPEQETVYHEDVQMGAEDAGLLPPTDQMDPLLPVEVALVEPEQVGAVSQNVTSTPSGRGSRELRTLCFRILATVIRKFETVDFHPLYWDVFFNSIQPSIARLAAENSAGAPTALLQCILAISQRVDFALLLAKDPELVPAILSILATNGPSVEVVAAVLTFIENIFSLEEQNDGDGAGACEAVKVILLPHLNIVLHSLRATLSARCESAKERRSLKRELRILTHLSKHIKDSTVAAALQDALLPMLRVKRRLDQDLCLEVLSLLQAVASILEPPATTKCLPVLASLLVNTSMQDIRTAISEVLSALGRADSGLLEVAALITDLNSISTSTVGEFDYERRLHAYDRMTKSLFVQLTQAQALVLLSHVIFDMGSDDMSIRHRASECLQQYVRYAAEDAQKPESAVDAIKEARNPEAAECAEKPGTVEGAQSVEAVEDAQKSTVVEAQKSGCISSEEFEGGLVRNDVTEDIVKDDDFLIKCDKESKSLVSTLLLRHVRNGIGSEAVVVRREWVLLLREMTMNFVGDPNFKEYEPLISKDVETDFFYNVGHLQVHRRIRAMAKFRGLCSCGPFSQGALSRIFIPLFRSSLIEAKGDKEGNLATGAVETISCIASQLRWEPYCGLLMQSLRLIATKPERQKLLVRLVCAILDAFHFFLPTAVEEKDVELTKSLGESGASSKPDGAAFQGAEGYEGQPGDNGDFNPRENVTKETSDPEGGDERDDGDLDRELPPDVRNILRKRVVPEIKKLMVSKEGIVSSPVSLTLVKILLLMPESIVETELPQVIQSMVNSLKSRSQAVRDEARAALVAIVETLGAKYLHYVVDVLKASLTRGYELHVLGYTMNSILVRLIPKVEVGEIDYCLEQVLEVLENDIFGEVAEEKDVEAIAAKMKETRHMRSFESMRLLAQVVTFRSKIVVLLEPVRRNLQNALAPKVKPKLQNMLQHILQGILHNKSITQTDLFVILYALVEDGVKEERAIVSAVSARKQAKSFNVLSTSDEGQTQAEKTFSAHTHLITEFALQLLHSYLRRAGHHKEDTLVMLNPYVELLSQCLATKYDGVLALALKNFGLLLLLPLPAVESHGIRITEILFSISQRFAKAENTLLQACLSVLVVLIRQCKSLRLSEDQLHALLGLPIFVDLEAGSRMALSLLKAIVWRELLVPELYDMMNRVAQLMVTSYAPTVRQICSQILLQFLLQYPLGKKRLQQHLDFIISNVGYAESSGREAALEMLHTVILKFPDEVVGEHADSMFFPLVTRLVNDDFNQVRSMIGTILKELMGRVSHQSLQRMLEFALSWYKSADQRLWRTAAQVLGFLVQVKGKIVEKHLQSILQRCVEVLEEEISLRGPELDEGQKSDAWQNAYFSLTMMEKLLQDSQELTLSSDLKPFWMLVSSHLLHQHVWIRKGCGRLLSFYFSASGVPSLERLEAVALGNEDVMLWHPSWILFLAASLCRQLDSSAVDDSMAEQLVKLLEVTCTILTLLPEKVATRSAGISFLGCEDAESEDRTARSLHLLGREGRIQDGTLSFNGIEVTTSTIEDGTGPRNAAVLSLIFSKLQSVALRVYPSQTKVVLRWYARMAVVLGANGIEPHLPSMLIVLIKITAGTASKVVSEDLKALGEEIVNQLRELVGTVKFLHCYNSAREKEKEKRERRRQSQKVAAVTNPEEHAKRKINLTAKRQAQKKRKVMKEKISRGL